MKKILLSFALILMLSASFISASFAQTISRKGDTLIATPAKSYQWLKNGQVLNGETNPRYVPKDAGNYTVKTSDVSLAFKYQNKYTFVSGLVYNEKLEPIANVSLKINGIATKTDANGRYVTRFPISERAVIRAEHPEYQSRSLGFVTTDAETLYKDVRLEKFTVTHTFDATRSTMLGTNNFSIVMPDSGVMNTKTGKPFYGKVSVHLSAHQPGEALFGEQMPGGDFLGITKDGQENILYSYGFFGCELKDDKGEALNLIPGTTARATFQTNPNQKSKLQENVPLWHFDENLATWVEAGMTKRAGNSYFAEVPHFSSWNCDWSGPRSWVEGEVMACNGTNVTGGTVYTDQAPVQVNSNGYYKGWVPAGLEIDVLSSNRNKEHTTPKLNPDQTETVPKFAINSLRGFGLIDTTGYLKIYKSGGEGVVSYSVDGGKNFQASPEFRFEKGDTARKNCVVRDDKGCESRFEAKMLKMYFQECELLPWTEIYNNTANSTFEYLVALNSGQPKYGLGLFGETDFITWLENQGMMGCLQGFFINNLLNLNMALTLQGLQASPQLQMLELYNCSLTSLPDIGYWKNLQSLGFANNELTSLPTAVGEWKNLQDLFLSTNQLTSLPTEVGEWKNLQTLHLNTNQLTSLPTEVGEWKNLQILNFDNNQLTSLPATVGGWKNLQTLYLENNQLTSLPTAVGEWKNLTFLDLSSNQLTTLPAEIANLKDNLKDLYLGGNNFSPEEKAKIRSWLPNTTIGW